MEKPCKIKLEMASKAVVLGGLHHQGAAHSLGDARLQRLREHLKGIPHREAQEKTRKDEEKMN